MLHGTKTHTVTFVTHTKKEVGNLALRMYSFASSYFVGVCVCVIRRFCKDTNA
jgi:hypothetical protein